MDGGLAGSPARERSARHSSRPWIAAGLMVGAAFAAELATPRNPATGLFFLVPLLAVGLGPRPGPRIALAGGCLVLLVSGWAVAGNLAARELAPDRALVATSLLFVGAVRLIDGRRQARWETERTLLQQRTADLGRSEERYRATFDHAGVGIGHVAVDGRWLRVNDRLCEMLGFSRPELLDRTFSDVTHPEDRVRGAELFRRLESGEISRYELHKRYVRRDGQPLWVNLSVSLKRDEAGEPEYGIGVIQDISAQKAAEAELDDSRQALALAHEALEARVRQRTAELADAIVNLERSNAELEQFAYVASHDLQEPLRMVASYTQLLARRYRGRLDEEADRFIDFAVEGSQRMQTLIQGLLAYSRVQPTDAQLAVDTNEVLRVALANLAGAIREAEATIEQDELPKVHANRVQLLQVFQNLLSNAIKFRAGSPPHVRVGAEKVPEGWCFFVQDDGIGIEPEFHDRIFRIFQRLHGKHAYSGSGIGLALCKRIVEAHGGRIWVEEAEPSGSVFRFIIPQLPSHVS